jgi:molybdopterin-guanine dinucleotide biosynthesis protein A
MGRPKADLEWHGSTLLYRTSALLRRTVDGPVVVVRAPGQALPALPSGVETAEDPVAGLGPMQGVAAGLTAVGERAAAAFVCSTDLPFLHPAFVRRVLRGLDDPRVDVVLPVARGFRQPLAAGYRPRLAGTIDALIARGTLRPGMLLEHCTAELPDDRALLTDDELAARDPDLESVVNVNTPQEYAAARARPTPQVVTECFGTLATPGRRGRHAVAAATLAQAAAAVGLALDRHVVVALNGDQLTRDPQLPLVSGDVVAFLSADAGG